MMIVVMGMIQTDCDGDVQVAAVYDERHDAAEGDSNRYQFVEAVMLEVGRLPHRLIATAAKRDHEGVIHAGHPLRRCLRSRLPRSVGADER